MFNFFRRKPKSDDPQPLAYRCPDGPKNRHLQDLLGQLTPRDRAEFDQIAAGTRYDVLTITLGSDDLRRATAHAFLKRPIHNTDYPGIMGEPQEPLESAA